MDERYEQTDLFLGAMDIDQITGIPTWTRMMTESMAWASSSTPAIPSSSLIDLLRFLPGLACNTTHWSWSVSDEERFETWTSSCFIHSSATENDEKLSHLPNGICITPVINVNHQNCNILELQLSWVFSYMEWKIEAEICAGFALFFTCNNPIYNFFGLCILLRHKEMRTRGAPKE